MKVLSTIIGPSDGIVAVLYVCFRGGKGAGRVSATLDHEKSRTNRVETPLLICLGMCVPEVQTLVIRSIEGLVLVLDWNEHVPAVTHVLQHDLLAWTVVNLAEENLGTVGVALDRESSVVTNIVDQHNWTTSKGATSWTELKLLRLGADIVVADKGTVKVSSQVALAANQCNQPVASIIDDPSLVHGTMVAE